MLRGVQCKRTHRRSDKPTYMVSGVEAQASRPGCPLSLAAEPPCEYNCAHGETANGKSYVDG